MTRKLKLTGGKSDAIKKKSEMDNADNRIKGKKNGHDDKHDALPLSKTKPAMSAARKRWIMPAKAWDSTLANLRIQLNTLQRTGPRNFKKPIRKINYCVKKIDKMARPVEMTYAVLRRVPGDMDSILWAPERLDGLRYHKGLPVSHSILVSVADYLTSVENRFDAEIKPIEFRSYNKLPHIKLKETGFQSYSPSLDSKERTSTSGNYNQLTDTRPEATEILNSFSPLPDIKPQQPKRDSDIMKYPPIKCTFNQGRALQNWENVLAKGHNLSEKISLKSRRSKDDLIMGNHSYKISRGQKKVFDDLESAWQWESRVTKSNGFWKQREKLGDNRRGVHMARTKLERGIDPETEVVYRPGSSRLDRNAYSFLDLEIKGGLPSGPKQIEPRSFNIPSKAMYPMPEMIVSAINEPTIEIGQHVLTWTNRNCEVDVELGIVTCPGQVKMGKIVVRNLGVCVVRFQLLKIPNMDHFNNLSSKINARECIFIDGKETIVLPNDFENISAIFHSHQAATCSEKWRIVTTPRLARDITLTIWGIAKNPKELGENSEDIEEKIEARVLQSFMESILDNMIEKICLLPPTSRTNDFPGDLERWFVKTRVANQLFTRVNPGLTYQSGPVYKIIEIAKISLPGVIFNTLALPLTEIRLSMCDLPEEVKFKSNVVTKNDVANVLMTYINELSYDVKLPMATTKYDMCKKLLLDVLNNICDTASRMKRVHGITFDMDFSIDIPKEQFLKPPAPIVSTQPSKGLAKTPPKTPSKTPSREKSKKKHAHMDPQGLSTSLPPESGTVRLGKIAKGINTAKKSQYKNRVRPIMYFKYLEKLNLHSYLIVRDCIDKLADYLSDLPEVPKLRM